MNWELNSITWDPWKVFHYLHIEEFVWSSLMIGIMHFEATKYTLENNTWFADDVGKHYKWMMFILLFLFHSSNLFLSQSLNLKLNLKQISFWNDSINKLENHKIRGHFILIEVMTVWSIRYFTTAALDMKYKFSFKKIKIMKVECIPVLQWKLGYF